MCLSASPRVPAISLIQPCIPESDGCSFWTHEFRVPNEAISLGYRQGGEFCILQISCVSSNTAPRGDAIDFCATCGLWCHQSL